MPEYTATEILTTLDNWYSNESKWVQNIASIDTNGQKWKYGVNPDATPQCMCLSAALFYLKPDNPPSNYYENITLEQARHETRNHIIAAAKQIHQPVTISEAYPIVYINDYLTNSFQEIKEILTLAITLSQENQNG